MVSSRSGARNSIIPKSIHYGPDAGADVESDPTLSIHELRPSLPALEIHLHWPAGRTLLRWRPGDRDCCRPRGGRRRAAGLTPGDRGRSPSFTGPSRAFRLSAPGRAPLLPGRTASTLGPLRLA